MYVVGESGTLQELQLTVLMGMMGPLSWVAIFSSSSWKNDNYLRQEIESLIHSKSLYKTVPAFKKNLDGIITQTKSLVKVKCSLKLSIYIFTSKSSRQDNCLGSLCAIWRGSELWTNVGDANNKISNKFVWWHSYRHKEKPLTLRNVNPVYLC